MYALSGIYGRREAATAIANAKNLDRLERTLGVGWEHGIQNWTLGAPHIFVGVANRLYFSSQFAISIAFLLWVYVRRNEHFTRIRNVLLGANYVSFVVLFLYPLTPPRMVPGAGYVDTLDENAVNLHSSMINALNNPYSAMPSLHASYALVVGVAGFLLVRSRPLRLVWLLYPGLVFYSVIATGNHFVLDLAAGAAALVAAPIVDRAVGAITRHARRRDADASWLGSERERA